MLIYGSIFSGIGGLDLGVELATGGRCAWHCEPDPYCAAVLARHWPGIPNHGDVTEASASTLSPVDLLVGGFPCQDVSQAGLRAGLDGERSGLWREQFRLVCDLEPQLVFVENVAGLAVRGLADVLGDLADGGYDAQWSSLRAADVGAPHLRRRLFILAARRSLSDAGRSWLRKLGQRWRQQHHESWPAIPRDDGQALADAVQRERSQSRPEPARPQTGRATAGGRPVADAAGERRPGGTASARRKTRNEPPGDGRPVADAVHDRQQGRGALDDRDRGHAPRYDPDRRHAFPPPPDDGAGWERWRRDGGPEPGVRRGTLGPPRGLDARRRRARLQHLGNTCCPYQAAAAILGLAARMEHDRCDP